MIQAITHAIVATAAQEYEFTTEWLAIISRAETEVYSVPGSATQISCDLLIRDMMTSGIWEKLDIYFHFSYNDSSLNNFSLINWRNPAGSLAVAGGDMTYTVSGWKGGGSTGYVTSNFNPATSGVNYTLNKASHGGIIYEAPTGNSTIDGINGSPNNRMFAENTTNHRINGGNLSAAVDLSGTGFTMITRSDSANVELVKKAVHTTIANASTSIHSANQRMLNSGAQFGNAGLSCYLMGDYITNTEAQAFRGDYNEHLGRIGLTEVA